MSIPGQNILNMASQLILFQTIQYYQFESRALNAIGQDVATYLSVVNIIGSWQPVPRKLYIVYGLDLQKDYFTFYTSNPVLDLDRDITADQVAFNGQLFQVESDNDWYALDGWKGILCIHTGADVQQSNIFGFNTLPLTNDYLNFNNSNFLGSDIN